jgi:hypothetical protein
MKVCRTVFLYAPLFALSFVSSLGYAQERVPPDAPAPTPLKKSGPKNLKKSNAKPGVQLPASEIPAAPEMQSILGDGSSSTESTEPKNDWLPSWGGTEFDFGLNPELGFLYQEVNGVQSSQLELGLGLFGSAPLATTPSTKVGLKAWGGYAWGYMTVKPPSSLLDTKIQTGNTHRYWLGTEIPIAIQFLKFTPGIEFGQLTGKLISNSRVLKSSLDSAILLKAWWSAHLTNTHTLNWENSASKANFAAFDTWLHTRFFTNFLNFYNDHGPGVTLATTYAYEKNQETGVETHEKIGSSTTTYWQSLAGANLFWKLGFDAMLKYVFASNIEPNRDAVLLSRLPNQGLSQPSLFATYPADTLHASVFLGLKDIFYGVGFGYRFNYTNTSATGSGKVKEETKTQSVGLQYSKRL